MCPTCEKHHPSRPCCGLNVCLSDSQLHKFHWTREPGVSRPPDSLHVAWVTIPGATVSNLEHDWHVDYAKNMIPMRVLLVAGINDMLKGGNMTSITNSILHLKNRFDEQNTFHPKTSC